ncbi:MAG: CHAP domain-containing protein [Micropepsaceae bacterium]
MVTAQVQQPTITAASTALARVTEALDVSVRQINATGRPPASLVASADVNPRTVLISRRLQCVPFARERSGVAIRGNANTWWNQAAGDFIRVKAPTVGSVMVMQTRRGHVGVVTKIIDSRHIVIDHSNWLSNGQIYLDQPVMDVSANNDWSKVVVWHPNLSQFGKRALGVSGFIVDAPARGNSTVYASLADVPANLAGDIQYAEAVVTAPKSAPAAAPVETRTPVLVAEAPTGPALQPIAKPDTVTVTVTAPVAMAAAKPVYVDTIVPASKPASIAAPMALASAEQIQQAEAAEAARAAAPVYVDTIVPKSKPAALSAPAAIASAEPAPSAAAPVEVAAAAPTYVDTVVPKSKPSVLGAAAVAEIRKGDTTTTAETAFVPSGKPASVATFR